MTTQELDPAKLSAFEQKMAAIYDSQAIGLLIGIGDQTGLFDTMAKLTPSTSEQIAAAAGLNERYVREWLGGMVVSRVIEYDPVSATYALPPEHAARLVSTGWNMARTAQNMTALSYVEQSVVESFRKGGGVPYSAYSRLYQIEWSPDKSWIIDTRLSAVPEVIERLQQGIDVADIGCGDGAVVNILAQNFPNSRFTGYDFSETRLAKGKKYAEQMGLTNARFEFKDVATLDVVSQFDFITAFDAIHDQAQPATVLRGIANALRPGGTFLMVDIAASSKLEENLDLPLAPWLYCYSVMHCMTVSLALNGEGLGTMWGRQKAQQMLADAGFIGVEIKRVESDAMNHYYIATKGHPS